MPNGYLNGNMAQHLSKDELAYYLSLDLIDDPRAVIKHAADDLKGVANLQRDLLELDQARRENQTDLEASNKLLDTIHKAIVKHQESDE